MIIQPVITITERENDTIIEVYFPLSGGWILLSDPSATKEDLLALIDTEEKQLKKLQSL